MCRHPMPRGGPEVTEGLSPRIRSYSRMLTLAKEMERPRVLALLLRGRPFVVDLPLWRDSVSVREDMQLTMGRCRRGSEVKFELLESSLVWMRMVGAELEMDWLMDMPSCDGLRLYLENIPLLEGEERAVGRGC